MALRRSGVRIPSAPHHFTYRILPHGVRAASCLALLLGSASCPSAQQLSNRPAALVLVQPANDVTMLVVTFSDRQPHARAQQVVRDIARRCGAKVAALSVHEASLDGNPRSAHAKEVQTAAEATLAGASLVLDDAFLLQPIVEALKDTGRFDVLFMSAPPREFKGLRAFQGDGVSIRLTQEGPPFRYSVTVADRTVAIPTLPLREFPTQAVQINQAHTTPQQPWGAVVVISIAAGVGVVVFVVMRRRAAIRASGSAAHMGSR